MPKDTETVALPIEAFALLIRSTAQAIIHELELPATQVRVALLQECAAQVAELVGKFVLLSDRERG